MNGVAGATRPWNTPASHMVEKSERTYIGKRCVLTDGHCAGSTMARTISLLPDVQIAILLCDSHNAYLGRRSVEMRAMVDELQKLKQHQCSEKVKRVTVSKVVRPMALKKVQAA